MSRWSGFWGYLTSIEKSPNPIKAYAHDLKDWFTYLTGHELDWQGIVRLFGGQGVRGSVGQDGVAAVPWSDGC